MRKVLGLGLAGVVATATLAFEGDAQACGGCFSPQENPTVVSDHRMIFSISQQQSTLYDQIKYSGSPDSFAWVLPISGEVTVGLSADIVFGALDSVTQTRIVAPPRNCPGPPSNCGTPSANAGSGGSSGSSGGVDVTKREVVGPYETVQLKATDPSALQSWLAQNKFVVPADVKPVIDQYVTEKFDFLALKLLPGKGVQDMRPVRVTTKGSNVALPLRMVAAGTGATVGVSLWVIAEGRYQPANFPTFSITNDELTWDWNQSKSNYTELRAAKTTAGGGKAWEIESSTIVYRQTIENLVRNGSYGGSSGGKNGADYQPVTDPQGNVLKTADQVRDEDMNALFSGIPTATGRVTRVRADLAHAALATDLSLTASSDQDVFPNVRNVTKEQNQPQCPVYSGCEQTGTAPRDEAQARTNGSGESFSCAAVTKRAESSSPVWLALGGGALALALAHAIRRRK